VSPESAATSIARIRIAIGVAAVAAPGLTARVVSGGRDASGTARLFARLFGGRDLALGLGTVIALDRGKPVRGWLEASALADVIDCTACSLGGEDMSPIILRIAAGFGAAAAFAGLFLSRRLDPPPPAHPGHPEAVWTGHGVSSSAR
jgi:hypothetical protein